MSDRIIKFVENSLDTLNDLNGTEKVGTALVVISILIGVIMMLIFVKIASFLV